MAYQDISAPAQVLNNEIAATRNFFGRVGAFFAGFGQSFSYASSAQVRFNRVQALQAKTDAELTELNIRRDEIVHHVFRDLYYI